MKTLKHTLQDSVGVTEVKAILHDVGYVLWLVRKLASESQAEKCRPVRPEMSEFCAVEIAACAA